MFKVSAKLPRKMKLPPCDQNSPPRREILLISSDAGRQSSAVPVHADP